MAKLHFKYATMGSGKTLDLLRSSYNYEEQGKNVLVLKPKIDSKGNNKIVTRVGLERKVDFLIDEKDSILETLKGHINNISCILVDEVQMFSSEQVDELYIITKALDIPILCYGLRTNFKSYAFEGSKRLLELADEISTFRSVCECGKIARFNARKENDEFVYDGNEIEIDGEKSNISYVPLCGECYLKKVKKLNLIKIKENM